MTASKITEKKHSDFSDKHVLIKLISKAKMKQFRHVEHSGCTNYLVQALLESTVKRLQVDLVKLEMYRKSRKA